MLRTLGKPSNYGFHMSNNLIEKSDKFQALLNCIEKISSSELPVLIVGETGTGKEEVANLIHEKSLRSAKPFVKVSIADLNPSLIESELFGHERGAFTNAVSRKIGLIEQADGGTLFLDEIDDLPINLQVKLLRVLENSELRSVGSIIVKKINVRILVASKVNLHQLVENGSFRKDLYYRLNIFPIKVPPLRDRIEDIPALLDAFISANSSLNNLYFSRAAMDVLRSYHWPGNVRELKNLVLRMTLVGKDNIEVEDLPEEISPLSQSSCNLSEYFNTDDMYYGEFCVDFKDYIEQTEIKLIKIALTRTHGNITNAAAILNLKLSTLRDKLIKYHLQTRENSSH